MLAIALAVNLHSALILLAQIVVLGVEVQSHDLAVVEVFLKLADDLHVCRVP
jgi:hypothetical protein